ncbi:MAG: glycosyltransferase [Desulfobacterales bacterium]
MKISDVLIFPSWSEGLPNVVMEAMAAGLPVVASGVGGIPEILENGVNGLLVPPRNVQSLITATGRMLNDKKLSQDCIRNAKRLIRERFDVKKNVDELCTLLQQMRAGNSSFPRNEKR